MKILREDAVRGRSVIDSTGRTVGEVDSLIVETDTWTVEAVRIKLHRDVSKELGLPREVFRAARLDVPTREVSAFADTVLLAIPIGALRTADPAWTPEVV